MGEYEALVAWHLFETVMESNNDAKYILLCLSQILTKQWQNMYIYVWNLICSSARVCLETEVGICNVRNSVGNS